MTTISLPAGAMLRPLELPARADAAPSPLIREYAAARNQSILESTGRDDDALSAEALLPMLFSTPDCERLRWAVLVDDQVIGCCSIDLLRDEDGQTARATVAVLDSHAGRGIGSAAFAHLESVARAAGIRKILAWAEHHDDGTGRESLTPPTGFGSVPSDRSARFLVRHGFTLEQVERVSALTWEAQTLSHLDALYVDAAAHAADYRIVQWGAPTPPEHADGFAWLKSRMSTDAPDADLGSPEEVWDAARVAQQEERVLIRGWSMQITAAQHTRTGELCAFNELAIGTDPSETTHQWDTLVLREHRGHRLGMLVKTAGLRSWHARHPASSRVVTYNAEENRPMLSINEAIGFTPVAYEGAWKKELR